MTRALSTLLQVSFALLLTLALTATPAHADPPSAHGNAHASTGASAVTPAPEGVVNINSATEDELMRLPGIGPARAHAITTLRERVHQFGHAEDLLRVRGIGRVGMRHLRPYVSLTGPTTLANRPGHAPASEGTTDSDAH